MKLTILVLVASLQVGMSCTAAEVLPNSTLARSLVPPPGFVPPPLHPGGVELETRQLGKGIYALMSNTPFTDNAGFIVGRDAVLVIDAHFNGAMGQQIVDAVRRITDRPIKYLLNTNAFGDHVFGNYVFPHETTIVAHQSTIDALRISSVEGMSRTMSRTVGGDLSVFAGVELRLPEVGFDTYWHVDLGGRRVEMHWFGQGMSPHDSIVYVPEAKIAWTANMVFGEGTIPWARSGNIAAYLETLQRFSAKIQPKIIVPGHGKIATGGIIDTYQRYLVGVLEAGTLAVAGGLSVEALVADAEVSADYSISPPLRVLMTGFHRWNLQAAYREVVR